MIRVLGWPAFKNRSLNPYNWLLYSHLAASGIVIEEFTAQRLIRGHYNIWHIHWPDFFISKQIFIEAFIRSHILLWFIDFAKTRKTKIVWTIHNFSSHEGFHPNLESWFWKAFVSRIDGYISLSNTGKDMALERFPELRDRPGFVIPHGHYRTEYPNNLTRLEARTTLRIPAAARVLTFVGQVRSYKNLPQLVHAFRQIKDPEVILFVVGTAISRELKDILEKEAVLDSRVRLRMGFIQKDQMQTYLLSSDLIVLPYREILNSGTALLALSFDRPLLVPSLGAFPELQDLVGKEWVHTYKGDITREVIERGLQWVVNTSRANEAPLEALDWGRIAQLTTDAYNTVLMEKKII